VAATVNQSGISDVPLGGEGIVRRMVPLAYEQAGIGPGDLDVVEVHDATSVSEYGFMEDLGVCATGEAKDWIDRGWTEIGGKVAFNTSGGLVTKGHPVGATGLGMIAEVIWQLRGEADERQVADAKVGLTLNGGGVLGTEPAAMSIHIFKR